jgi:hypothetical protein
MAAPPGFVERAAQEDFESQVAGHGIPSAGTPDAGI